RWPNCSAPSTSTGRPRTASRYDRVARRVTTLPDRMIDDVVSVLERFEALLEGLSDDGRVLFYARDLTRRGTWLRSQPRSRLRVDLDAAQARISRALSNDGLRVEDTPKGNR